MTRALFEGVFEAPTIMVIIITRVSFLREPQGTLVETFRESFADRY